MPARGLLLVIVTAQFCCTSVWFAGNAVLADLLRAFGSASQSPGAISASVQLGFIAGTLGFAVLAIADRFSPSRVFFVSALLSAAFNLSVVFLADSFSMLLTLRFFTGFFLAGIYPVGMKIAADHFGPRLGSALGYLVGALVLGTALPQLIRSIGLDLSWRWVFNATTLLTLTGGSMILILVPDGPYRKRAASFGFLSLFQAFRERPFRNAALGYFGHMWELYAFWAFVPVLLSAHHAAQKAVASNAALWSFIIIGTGSIGCAAAGLLSRRYGTVLLARSALFVSGLCCLLSPLAYMLPTPLFLFFLVCWGFFVVADSPMFSSMVAQYAPPENKGAALTIVNCIGFSITIASILLLDTVIAAAGPRLMFLFLAPGPCAGLYFLMQEGRNRQSVRRAVR